jgi:tetratricopeptide (TPR) repeat protein
VTLLCRRHCIKPESAFLPSLNRHGRFTGRFMRTPPVTFSLNGGVIKENMKILSFNTSPSRILKIFTAIFALGTVIIPYTHAQRSNVRNYPFDSSVFAQFVTDSNRAAPRVGADHFAAWWRERFQQFKHPDLPGATLDAALEARRQELRAVVNQKARDKLELRTAAALHALVKRLIPKFSFEYGFEFTNLVSLLERQCLSQSVLIAAMLQEAGVNAGTVMVWQSQSGEESNLGHVAVLLRLSGGRDVIIDASDRTPVMRHLGIYGFVGGKLSFVKPIFLNDASISSYKVLKTSRTIPAKAFQTLSVAFLRSQFYYYRGERAKNGFASVHSTRAGLEASAKSLIQSIALEPENPLAQYVLGHVYRRLGKLEAAKTQYTKGYALYQAQGYVPFEPLAAMKHFVWKTP